MSDQPTPDLAAIRRLLLASFQPETLRRFCQDRPLFRPIVDTFGPNHGLDDMVDEVITYCTNHLLFPELMAELQLQFPRHFGPPVDPAEHWTEGLKTYKKRMAERYGTTQIFGQPRPVPLDQVFTDVYILEKPAAFRRFDIHQLQQDPDVIRDAKRVPGCSLVTQPDAHRLFILGRPGAGKTTFLKHLVLEAARENLDKVPIFVTLKEWADQGQDLIAFIVQQFALCGFPDAGLFVQHLLCATDTALVLFDGLDEVPQENKAHERAITALKTFAEQYPCAQCLVTCRTAATDYTFERFGYVEVADFTQKQIETLVRKWFHAEPGKGVTFLAEITREQNRGLLELARTPLLLAMLCLAFNETLHFPARRVEIYQDALEALLRKWDSSRSIRRDEVYRALSPGRKQQLFARIAAQSFEQAEYFLPQAKLGTQIRDYLSGLPKADIAGEGEIDGWQVLRSIEAQHGILVERAHRIYSFAHLSFQEYYSARYFVENVAQGTLTGLAAHCTDRRWREVFLLTASLLDNADALFCAFRLALDSIIAKDTQICAFVRWAGEKSTDVEANAKPAALRSYYLHFALAAGEEPDLTPELARALISNFGFSVLQPTLLNPTPVLNLALTLTLALDDSLALDLALDRQLVQALPVNRLHGGQSSAVQRILLLGKRIEAAMADLRYSYSSASDCGSKSAIPTISAEALNRALDRILIRLLKVYNIHQRKDLFRSRAWHIAVRLSNAIKGPDLTIVSQSSWPTTLVQCRNIGQQWNFTVDQAELLSEYLEATLFLLECLDVAYVSHRQAIEDSLLLPPGTWQPEDLVK